EAFGGVAVHRIVGGPGPAAEARRLVVVEGLADFGGRRHHERTVLDDGLADGATLEQQQVGCSRAILEHERVIGPHTERVAYGHAARTDAESFAFEEVEHAVRAGCGRRYGDAGARRHPD